jgi:hypothetical protein
MTDEPKMLGYPEQAKLLAAFKEKAAAAKTAAALDAAYAKHISARVHELDGATVATAEVAYLARLSELG